MKINKFSFLAAVTLLAIPALSVARADHLLISEILINPTGIQTDDISAEYVEIFNPTSSTITLDNYYLSSYKEYYTLPAGSFDFGDRSDFMLRFPAGTSLAPNHTIVVTQGAVSFIAQLGLEFGGDLIGFGNQIASPALLEVKDTMLTVNNMVNLKIGQPRQDTLALNNTGGAVALFYWDGQTDLVQDVDLVRWGSPTTENSLAIKTGLTVDGPDADTDASTYAADAGVSGLTYTGSVIAMKRITSDEEDESTTAGNGITGHDETTENLHSSFASVAFPAITPGPPDIKLFPASVDDWQVY